MYRISADFGADRLDLPEVGQKRQLIINLRAAHGNKYYVLAARMRVWNLGDDFR